MNRLTTFSLSLLVSCIPVHMHSTSKHPAPITLESRMLKLFDGTAIFDANSVERIHKYVRRVQSFMHAPYPFGNTTHSLIECARLETTGALSTAVEPTFSQMLIDFASFSETFIGTISTAKPVLLELIKEFSTKRNRHDTILLAWAECANGDEQILLEREITSYNKLGSFCIDLIHFLGDLLHSCPKAVAEHTHRTNRLHDIRMHVDILLKERQLTIEGKAYETLIIALSKRYESYEDATPEKTTLKFDAYMNRS
jgi:hypothetical protein